jgi:hypothetical protein
MAPFMCRLTHAAVGKMCGRSEDQPVDSDIAFEINLHTRVIQFFFGDSRWSAY